jgi:WD40 repeat protein
MIFSYPFNEQVLDMINVHQGEVTKIIISPDNRYLFSTGSDGSIFIFSIGDQLMIMD